MAAERGHEQVADVLLSHRAYVGAKSKLGMTPLHLAAENGYASLVEMLVNEHKAQVDAYTLVSLAEHLSQDPLFTSSSQTCTVSFSCIRVFLNVTSYITTK